MKSQGTSSQISCAYSDDRGHAISNEEIGLKFFLFGQVGLKRVHILEKIAPFWEGVSIHELLGAREGVWRFLGIQFA